MRLKAGVSIDTRLRLVRQIGKGGMGSVWVAYHETLKTEVAIKFIEREARSLANALARFAREAEIAAKLKSPHVAHTYDHGTLEDGTPFIVMELLEGESLHTRLKRGPLSLHETSLVVGQTAQALGRAHKLGIVHRDVKPGNFFLIDTDYELFVKLLDFGIAKAQMTVTGEDLTKTGNILGSPPYMSPEQFSDVKNVDGRADLWSLAVVVYHCLTGETPFAGETLASVIMAVVDRDYEPITKIRPELPDALDQWFTRAFHEDLEERFQSAKELASSFVAIVRAHSESGKPRTPLPSIAEMTHAALKEQTPERATLKLPETVRLSTAEATREAVEDTAPITTNAPTFAPASSPVDRVERKRHFGPLLGAAALLLAAGLGSYAALTGSTKTDARPVAGQTSAGMQFEEPPSSATAQSALAFSVSAHTAPSNVDTAATTSTKAEVASAAAAPSASVKKPPASAPPQHTASESAPSAGVRAPDPPLPFPQTPEPYVPADTGF